MKKELKLRKTMLLFFSFIYIILMLTGCGTASDTDTNEEGADNSDKPLKIGVILSFTGPFASLSESVKEGIDLYITENGDKLGEKNIEIIYEDDEGDQTQALSKYRKLVTGDEVDILIGTVSSSITYAIRDRVEKDEIVLIKPIPTGLELTWDNRSNYIFSNLMTNWQNGAAASKYVADNIGKKAVTIAPDYVAGHEMIDSFTKEFESAGGEVIEQFYPEQGTNDFATQLNQISQLKPDVVYSFMAGSDAINLVKQYDELGLKEKIPFAGTQEFGDVLLTNPAGKASEGIISAIVYSPWLENDLNEPFVNNYQEKYEELPNIFSVGGYDAAHMIDKAVSQADSVESDDLVSELKGMTFDSPRGQVTIDSETNTPVSDFYITRNIIEDGTVVPEILEVIEDFRMPEAEGSND